MKFLDVADQVDQQKAQQRREAAVRRREAAVRYWDLVGRAASDDAATPRDAEDLAASMRELEISTPQFLADVADVRSVREVVRTCDRQAAVAAQKAEAARACAMREEAKRMRAAAAQMEADAREVVARASAGVSAVDRALLDADDMEATLAGRGYPGHLVADKLAAAAGKPRRFRVLAAELFDGVAVRRRGDVVVMLGEPDPAIYEPLPETAG